MKALKPKRTLERCESPTATSPPMPSVDTFTPAPIGKCDSDDCFEGAGGAGASAAEESGESALAAAKLAVAKLANNKSTAHTGALRIFSPQESELSTRNTLRWISWL